MGLLRSFVITIVDVGERGGREREGERDGDLGRERGRVFHTNMIVGK